MDQLGNAVACCRHAGTVRVGAIALAAAAGLFCGWAAGPAAAQGVEAFYKANGLAILVGHDAGGGYDLYSRVLARHMGKHIPGQPSIVVRNMPGAGGMKMLAHLYASVPGDGAAIGISDRGMLIEPLVSNAAQFDTAKMGAVGSIGRQTPTCAVWHGAKARTIEAARVEETLVGSTGPGATSIYPTIVNSVIKTKFKVISGYRGSAEIMHAMEKGEVEAVCLSFDTLKTLKPDWLADGRLKILVQMGIERNPEIKDIPMAADFAANEDDGKMLALYFGPNDMGRPYLGPPGIPADRLAALRRAFDATMRDPAYLAEARSLKMDVDPMSGEAMERLLKSFYDSPPQIVQRLKAVMDQFRGR